jgi:hypothetical protein
VSSLNLRSRLYRNGVSKQSRERPERVSLGRAENRWHLTSHEGFSVIFGEMPCHPHDV